MVAGLFEAWGSGELVLSTCLIHCLICLGLGGSHTPDGISWDIMSRYGICTYIVIMYIYIHMNIYEHMYM